MTGEPPQGRRFSHLYVERGTPQTDSPRMRSRLAALLSAFDDLGGIAREIQRELGVGVPTFGMGYDWQRFFGGSPLNDVLDTVTLA